MYRVRIERQAQKKLRQLSEPFYSKIKTPILNLGKNPRPNSSKKLKGREGYRIRVGNYRIMYEIADDILLVDVIDLGHRKEIYD